MAEEQELNVCSSSGSPAIEDSNPCHICLAPIFQLSYLDKCFHKFCYKCILQWTKVVSSKQSVPSSSVKCPLCKMVVDFLIIHGYDGYSFQKHYINQDSGDRFLSRHLMNHGIGSPASTAKLLASKLAEQGNPSTYAESKSYALNSCLRILIKKSRIRFWSKCFDETIQELSEVIKVF